MIERVTHKMVQAGNVIEIYNYSTGYLKGFADKTEKTGRKADFQSDNYEEHRKQVLQRSKQTLRRLINSNHGQYGEQFTSKFLTLTFGGNETDLDYCNYEFEKFIKRLNYLVFNTKKANLKYNVVIEFQERGAVHYHCIIYNMPYVKQDIISETWGNGWIFINKIDDVDNVGAYVAEYLGDEEKGQGREVKDGRLQGRKSYFSSRGLFKPIEFTEKKVIEAVTAALPQSNLVYTAEFNNEHLGNILYKQYNLNRK